MKNALFGKDLCELYSFGYKSDRFYGKLIQRVKPSEMKGTRIFSYDEVRVRRSRDDNRTFCLIYVKEAIGYCNQIWCLLCDSVV